MTRTLMGVLEIRVRQASSTPSASTRPGQTPVAKDLPRSLCSVSSCKEDQLKFGPGHTHHKGFVLRYKSGSLAGTPTLRSVAVGRLGLAGFCIQPTTSKLA